MGLFGDIVCLFDVCILLYLFSFGVKMLLFWGVVFMLLILRTWYGVVRGRSLFIRCLFIVVFVCLLFVCLIIIFIFKYPVPYDFILNDNSCYMSRDTRCPTMWYVRPTTPQISLRIRAV